MSRKSFARVKFSFRKTQKNKEIRSNGLRIQYRYMNVLQHTRNELNLCLQQNRPDCSYRDSLLNPILTKIDKFNYLTSLLTHYGRQQLFSAHMDELLKICACPSYKPHQLRHFYDKLSVNIRALEALDVKADQYGTLLIPIPKFPPEIRVHVARNTTQDVWNIKSILNVIQSEIEAREISEKVKAMAKRPSYQKPDNLTTSSFLTDSRQPFQTPKCVYCSERHFSASCEIVTDYNARKSILKRDKRCFKWFGKRHNSEQRGKR